MIANGSTANHGIPGAPGYTLEEHERHLLGIYLLDPRRISQFDVPNGLFADARHRYAFDIVNALHFDGLKVTAEEVFARAQKLGQDVGGFDYLCNLVLQCDPPASLAFHTTWLLKAYVTRESEKAFLKSQRDIQAGQEVAEAVEALRQTIARLPSIELGPALEKNNACKAVSIKHLRQQFPAMRPPRIHGLLRQGEVGNVIAAPKVGKSWLSQELALSVAVGLDWIGFQVEPGPVCLIDNELHPESIASRLSWIAEKRGLDVDSADVHAISLRGKGLDLFSLRPIFKEMRKQFAVIILDAWYRFIPRGMDENKNADVMALYNTLDEYAALTGATFLSVHHTSKGQQAGKSITDVGSGAGAQARAADAHMVIREHQQEGVFVVEAICRSFPVPDPFCVRREFPLWRRADDLDPTLLKQNCRSGRSPKLPDVPIEAEPWTAERFTREFIVREPRTTSIIESYARAAGLPVRDIPRLLDQIRTTGLAQFEPCKGRKAATYRLPMPDLLDNANA